MILRWNSLRTATRLRPISPIIKFNVTESLNLIKLPKSEGNLTKFDEKTTNFDREIYCCFAYSVVRALAMASVILAAAAAY